MSFILDALKKSEIDRQRQSLPGLMDSPAIARRAGLPLWALLLAILMALNMAALAFILLRHAGPTAPAAAKRSEAPVAANAQAGTDAVAENAPAISEHFSPLGAPVYAPEIALAPRADAPRVAGQRPAARAVTRRPEPVLSDTDAGADSAEVLPSINELNLAGAQSLPELHLDVHVFATQPSERFVYINMRKYHEGSSLPEGPVIERIRRDGVVLRYQGLRFILPRQS